MLAGILLLYFVGRGPVPDAAAAGALAGLVLDLCGTGELYLAVVLCAAASAAAGLRRGQRLPAAAAFCTAGVLAALLLGEVRPLAVLCQLLTAAGVWLLLPEKEGPLLTAAGEVSPEAAAPAAAFRAVYDSLEDHAPLLRPENPAVLFDRAAEQVCRDCPLRSDCWQTHYTDTYNAFNDACPALLRRGRRISRRTLRIAVCVFPSCWGRWTDSSMISSSAGCTTGGWTRPIVWPGSSTGRWPRYCHGPPRRNGSAAHT